MVSNKEGWETCAMTDVATKIRKLRKARELTQEQLADRVGTSSEYISLIETGKRKGGTELIAKIANALGISLNDLLDVNNFEAQQPRYKMPVKARVVAGIADEAVEIMSEPIGWEWSSEEPTDDRDVIEIYGD
jgi:transcriptional regulator with XRE-family HTH domain